MRIRARSLFLVLLVAKILAALSSEELHLDALLAFLWQDILVVALFVGCDAAIASKRVVWGLYAVTASYAALNLAVVQVLATPLTLPMLRATDTAISDSILHYLTLGNLVGPALVLGIGIVAPILWVRRAGTGPDLDARMSRSGLAISVLLVLSLLVGPFWTGRVTTDRHCNSIVALVGSLLPRVGAVELLASQQAGERDWREPVWKVSTESPDGLPSMEHLRARAAGRNVVLIVLESVGARYLAPYGADSDPMPTLTKLSRESLLFENAYAVYPESIKGLVALQYAVHPAIDTSPEQYRRTPTDALATVLARAGYRTGLFHSGRFEYLGMRSVIAGAGYHEMVDAADISGTRESSFGVEETATVRRALSWVDGTRRDDASAPFFLTYMPVAGHHPYDAPGQGPFAADELIGAYRNAIHFADRAIGELIAGLRARGVWRNTLCVVVGDHGQAFGQHPGNFGHTFYLYEENVQVPLLMAIPGELTATLRVPGVTSQVDVAPTILDLLGLRAPSGYEGTSALGNDRRMALLFTDYAAAFVGLRDGRYKFIHQFESGESLLFDLSSDPLEAHDLAACDPQRVAAYRQHLLAWSATQHARVAGWTP